MIIKLYVYSVRNLISWNSLCFPVISRARIRLLGKDAQTSASNYNMGGLKMFRSDSKFKLNS